MLILNGANRTDTTPSWQKYRSLGILRSFLQKQLSVRFFIVVVASILVGELGVQWQVVRVGEVFRPQPAPNSRGEPVSGNSGVVGLPVGSIKRVICV